MRYLVWVELDGFYTSVCDEPAPLIIVRERKVLDANPSARRRGVAVGMGVRPAKALVEGLLVRPWQEDRYAERRNQWLDVCTEFAGIIEPEDQHAASLDLTGHPDPLDVAERLVRSLSRKGMGRVLYGIAPSKWIARLAAGCEESVWVIDDPASFLAPLPVMDLLPIAQEHRERLHFLGYRQIGDLLQIPPATLQGQFGTEGLRIRQAALGALFEPVRARYPEGSLVDSFIFENPVDSTETLDAAVCALAKRLGERLIDGAWQSAKVALTIEDEEGERRTVERRFTKPLRDPLTALCALRLLVDARRSKSADGEPEHKGTVEPADDCAGGRALSLGSDEGTACLGMPGSGARDPSLGPTLRSITSLRDDDPPLNESSAHTPTPGPSPSTGHKHPGARGGVASICVKLTDLEAVRRKQAALNGFVPEGPRRPEADAALHYIRTVYGDRAVQRGSEVHLPRRVQVLREWKNATGWR